MRIRVIAALVAVPFSAAAEGPGKLEASGILGVDYFGDKIGLGGSPAPEQRPQTAPIFGARLSYLPLRVGGDVYLGVGVEGELTFTASWTGYGFDGPRPSVFAPVFGYHGNLLLRLGGSWLQPHVTVGGGAATVVSSSEFMADETDPVFLWGLGSTLRMADRWLLRFDARQGIMEAIDGGTTQTYEAHVSVGIRLGEPARREPAPPVIEVVEPPRPPEPDLDSDGDGIVDKLDACPMQPEWVNDVEDEDGCPEPDPDSDGLVGANDQCPDRAEDVDQFQDDDGCPDDDNDQDGIADASDSCPLQPETKNSFNDSDGCPDEVPAGLLTALQAAKGVTFKRGQVRLASKSKAALDKALPAMLSNRNVKFTITAHAEGAGDKAAQLAQRRADVVKFYLIEQGVAADNLTTVAGPPLANRKAPIVVLSLTP